MEETHASRYFPFAVLVLAVLALCRIFTLQISNHLYISLVFMDTCRILFDWNTLCLCVIMKLSLQYNNYSPQMWVMEYLFIIFHCYL